MFWRIVGFFGALTFFASGVDALSSGCEEVAFGGTRRNLTYSCVAHGEMPAVTAGCLMIGGGVVMMLFVAWPLIRAVRAHRRKDVGNFVALPALGQRRWLRSTSLASTPHTRVPSRRLTSDDAADTDHSLEPAAAYSRATAPEEFDEETEGARLRDLDRIDAATTDSAAMAYSTRRWSTAQLRAIRAALEERGIDTDVFDGYLLVPAHLAQFVGIVAEEETGQPAPIAFAPSSASHDIENDLTAGPSDSRRHSV